MVSPAQNPSRVRFGAYVDYARQETKLNERRITLFDFQAVNNVESFIKTEAAGILIATLWDCKQNLLLDESCS